MGTDTGGSIRGPSTVNGIVGLKPTHGLLSRSGIVPLALTFDTGGPMARSVYDVAVSLDRTSDKYFYIARGQQLLAEGERQNRDNPEIRWTLGFERPLPSSRDGRPADLRTSAVC